MFRKKCAIYNKTECSILTIAKNGMPVHINKLVKTKKVKITPKNWGDYK
jgi:hypothetical protein